MTTFNDLAPYPLSRDEVTAESLAKSLIVHALADHERVHELPDGADYRKAILGVVHVFGIVSLLRSLVEHAPEQADMVARDLWSEWDGGDGLGEWLWEWAVGWGIDPEQVQEITQAALKEKAAAAAEQVAQP